MKRLFVLMAAVALTFVASLARAEVAYFPEIYTAMNKAGIEIANGTYALLIDLDGDGWNGQSYLAQALAGSDNSSSWLWDSNDLLLDVGQIDSGMAFPVGRTNIVDGYDVDVDDYYLFWFDVAYNAAMTAPGIGIDYGVELLGKVAADGSTMTPEAFGGIAAFQTLGTQVVPEPVSTVLMLIGGGAMAFRRRFFA